MDLRKYIASIKDYPTPGIIFRDITPLMANGEAFQEAINNIVEFAKKKEVDVIVGPEARGFIVGCPVAYHLGVGFVPARKKGKLPRETISVDYGLEYGQSSLQIHKDSIMPGQRVLITDDLLATGGTIKATIDLVKQLGGEIVGAAFLIELQDLKGRQNISDIDVLALETYTESEL